MSRRRRGPWKHQAAVSARLPWLEIPNVSGCPRSRHLSGFSLISLFTCTHPLPFCLGPARCQRNNYPPQCCNFHLYHGTIQFFSSKKQGSNFTHASWDKHKRQKVWWRKNITREERRTVIHPSLQERRELLYKRGCLWCVRMLTPQTRVDSHSSSRKQPNSFLLSDSTGKRRSIAGLGGKSIFPVKKWDNWTLSPRPVFFELNS